MNGVFHSLRAEFDLSETYSGQAVLGLIITTIKNVTLQLLSGTDRFVSHPSKEEEEAEKESEDVTQTEEKSHQSAHVNGERAVKEGQHKEVEHERDTSSHQIVVSQEVEAERERVSESQIPSQTPDTVFNTEPEPRGPQTAEVESEQQEEQEEQSAASPAREEDDLIKVVDPDVSCEESSLAEDEQERNVVDSNDEDEAESAGEVASQKLFEPPVDPPPAPNTIQKSSTEDMSLTGRMGKENGKDPFFQITSPAKSMVASTEDEEEDEMNLKGRPPPTPLFGDEDDDDLDWLN